VSIRVHPWFIYLFRFLNMQPDIQAAKVALRKQIRGALQKISPAARNAMSAQVRDRLKEQVIWKNAGAVLFFAPMPDEPDVWPLLEDALAGKIIVALPRYDSASNSYGRVPGAKSAQRHCDRAIRHPRTGREMR